MAPPVFRHLLVGTRGRSFLLLTPAVLATRPTACLPPLARRTTAAITMPQSGRTFYCSTRGGVKDATFEDVVLGGLAPDRGLYVPQQGIPSIPDKELEEVRGFRFTHWIDAVQLDAWRSTTDDWDDCIWRFFINT